MDEFTIFLKAIDVFNTLALLDFSYLLTEELFLRGGHRWRLVDILGSLWSNLIDLMYLEV